MGSSVIDTRTTRLLSICITIRESYDDYDPTERMTRRTQNLSGEPIGSARLALRCEARAPQFGSSARCHRERGNHLAGSRGEELPGTSSVIAGMFPACQALNSSTAHGKVP